jgi:hypothetical protein
MKYAKQISLCLFRMFGSVKQFAWFRTVASSKAPKRFADEVSDTTMYNHGTNVCQQNAFYFFGMSNL